MAEQERYHKLTREELDRVVGEPLPERVAMSLINAKAAIPMLEAEPLGDNHRMPVEPPAES